MMNADTASRVLFGEAIENSSEDVFNCILGEVPTKEIEKSKLGGAGIPLVELLVYAGLSSSKGQARKDIEGGGVNLNNMRMNNVSHAVMTGDFLFHGKHILLRKGKKNYVVLTAK